LDDEEDMEAGLYEKDIKTGNMTLHVNENKDLDITLVETLFDLDDGGLEMLLRGILVHMSLLLALCSTQILMHSPDRTNNWNQQGLQSKRRRRNTNRRSQPS
jgi:hypothetical protein